MRSIWVVLISEIVLLSTVKADLIEITVDTDKDVYNMGESVTVYVSAYNPGFETITLSFATSSQANYFMDGIFDYSSYIISVPRCTEVQIAGNDSYTWTLKHMKDLLSAYPLLQGTHSVVGQVVGYGESGPAQFEVIPEPATLILLALGSLLVQRKK
jgi:hypothetical protein